MENGIVNQMLQIDKPIENNKSLPNKRNPFSHLYFFPFRMLTERISFELKFYWDCNLFRFSHLNVDDLVL